MRSKNIIWLAALLALAPIATQGAATIVIQNGDPAGVGFNDATVVAPVGGNTGTTKGAQRLIAFQAAADKWGATLTSSVTITVLATWEALTCTSASAVLGSAGAITIHKDFTGATQPNTWFCQALANKLAGLDNDAGSADLRARFNINLGNTGCLDGVPFYLGLDNNHGTAVDLVAVLTHEFCHGLGFQTFTSGSSGAQNGGSPSIYDYFLLDTVTSLHWNQETNAQRAASGINYSKLVWDGANVVASVPLVLSQGAPVLTISGTTTANGTYQIGTASFGPALNSPGVTAEVMPVVDTAPDSGLACTALSPLNAAAVNGKIALVDRGTCTFVAKALACQAAGAVGVIIANNAVGSPPPGLGGTDPTITIPVVSVTQADGVVLRAALAKRSRLHSGMIANIGVDLSQRAGANANNQARMYNPNPFQSGSSISHWDTAAFPNQLMEPAINGDLTHEVTPPQDLSFKLLQDTGW